MQLNPCAWRAINFTHRRKLSSRTGVEWIYLPFRLLGYLSPMSIVRRFLSDESGATAIEYGLIAAGISLAIIAVVNGLGTKLNTKFTSINSSLK
jgi:pilus assembly protein Flp/PilA